MTGLQEACSAARATSFVCAMAHFARSNDFEVAGPRRFLTELASYLRSWTHPAWIALRVPGFLAAGLFATHGE